MGIALGLIFLLASSALFAIAVVIHFHASHLSLPIGSGITFLTILLPILSLINSYIYPSILHSSLSSESRLHKITPIILQTLQALFTTVLATLLAERVASSPTVECLLDTKWMGMFRAKDATSIRLIQDTLNCCGLNSIVDRAYPFPKKDVNRGKSTCPETFGRDLACKGPWRAALNGSAGGDLGVVLAVGLLQILGLLFMSENTSWWAAWRTVGWGRQRERNNPNERPRILPQILEGDERVVEQQDQQGERYRDDPNNGQERRAVGYRDQDDDEETGPRIEPSGIHHEPSHWDR